MIAGLALVLLVALNLSADARPASEQVTHLPKKSYIFEGHNLCNYKKDNNPY